MAQVPGAYVIEVLAPEGSIVIMAFDIFNQVLAMPMISSPLDSLGARQSKHQGSLGATQPLAV